jgi:hypothetical protein
MDIFGAIEDVDPNAFFIQAPEKVTHAIRVESRTLEISREPAVAGDVELDPGGGQGVANFVAHSVTQDATGGDSCHAEKEAVGCGKFKRAARAAFKDPSKISCFFFGIKRAENKVFAEGVEQESCFEVGVGFSSHETENKATQMSFLRFAKKDRKQIVRGSGSTGSNFGWLGDPVATNRGL